MKVASAAQGTNDRDGGSSLVASHGGILVGHQAARCRGYSGGSRPFCGPQVPLPVFTLG